MNYQEYFIDYVNNFLTVECFAEHYGFTISEANNVINIGRAYNNKDFNGLNLLINN